MLDCGLRSCITAIEASLNSVLELLSSQPDAKLLDLGCAGGSYYSRLAYRIKTENIHGIEIYGKAAKDAHKHGFEVIKADLGKVFPFRAASFDVVTASQVIEHINDVDNFVSEIYRVLKPEGYTIISTENLSSLDNLFALFMGQQAFSQHISRKYMIGNKFSPHFGKHLSEERGGAWMRHKTIFTYYGIQQMLSAYGFKLEKIIGIPTFPLPRFLSKVDPIHCRFITIKARKQHHQG